MSSKKVSDKPAKKLKQACLPFKLVNSPGDDANSKCRKRKLSGTENSETRVDDSNVELLNGGTKCFIKSNEDKNNKKNNKEISVENICKEDSNEKSDNQVITSAENDVEKTDEEICDFDTSKVNDKTMEVDDTISISSDSDQIQIDTSINSTSDSGVIEKTTPTSKKLNSKRKQESAKKTEERLRLKQEKEKAREEKLKELAEKQRLKEEKRLAEIEAKRLRELEKEKERKQKEEERKARELEKEKERKQKEEERKARELEKEKERKQKEEERKAKEEERKAKEEERKAKELEKEKLKEEKLLKEETERKKNEKVKAAFVGFFKPKSVNLDTSIKDEDVIDKEQETYFMPFQTKQDMKVAPFCRAYLNSDKKKYMDKCISQCEQKIDLLYLSLLKTGNYKPSKSEATWPISVEDDDDLIIETGPDLTDDECGVTKIGSRKQKSRKNYRWKLLQFDENKRPPYWGTWRKTSLYIKPKRPFACDKIMFDYEIDSDDEWEEEDPGESIHGTDDEEEPEDDYEVDNDVFVPHGYLSDEEGQENDNDDSEETQKEKLKLLGEEFEAEIKKKTERIKPKLVGCIWIPNNVTEPKNVSKIVADTLLKYRCVWENEEPIITEAPITEDSSNDLPASENKKTSLLPESIMPDLITFIHGNKKYTNIKFAANSFINEFVKNGQNMDADNPISLSTVKKTIKAIATKSTQMSPWLVNKESFEKYGLEYPKIVEVEIPKSKSSISKITSFMTPQSQKVTALEKTFMEIDDVSESNKGGLIPKSLFDVKECISPTANEEQKVKIVDGKKRITPILLSPKKKFKLIANRKSMERSLSPEVKSSEEIVDK